MEMASNGQTDQAIANDLGISLATVSTYWGRIRIKYGPHGRTEIVARYLRAQMNRENAECHASESRLRSALECLPAGVLVTDADGVPIYANRRYEQMRERFSIDFREDQGATVGDVAMPFTSVHGYVSKGGEAVQIRTRGVRWRDGESVLGCVSLIEEIASPSEPTRFMSPSPAGISPIPASLFVFDEGLAIQSWNARASLTFGLAGESLLGCCLATLFDNVTPLDIGMAERSSDCGEGPRGERWRARGYRRDGSTFLCELTSVFSEGTRLVLVQEIEESVSAIPDWLESIPLPACRLNREGDMTSLNELMRNKVGRSGEVPMGKALSAYVHPEDVEIYSEALLSSSTEQVPVEVQLRLWSQSDMSYQWCRLSMRQVHDEEWLVVGTDIHDLEEASSTLRRVKNLLALSG